jgi:hypothetical protein
MSETYSEAALRVVISGIKSGLINEEEGKIMFEILTDVGRAAKGLASNLDESKQLMKVGSENAGVAMNGALVAAGIYTGGNSAVKFTVTQNLAAKRFYLLSVAFSLSAITNGGIAVVSRACELSGIGVFSEALGAGFMWCGNASRAAALKAEGKPIPNQLRNSIRIPRAFYGTNGMAFAMPGSCENIPFHTIGRVVGISLAIYGYSKLIIAAYRYSQQFIIKYKKNNNIVLELNTQVRFLVISLNKCPSIIKTKTIYKFATS